MKKKNLNKSHRSFEDDSDFYVGKKGTGSKNKGSKRKLSIYDDYEDDEDDFSSYEKFKKRK